ncbi:MAG: hypothetical protein NTZ49_06040 [Candidatus Parcubacteria bacterium]|nr:hypothetical protein [Candidatus Parcubacteria bacterium]
MSDDKLYEKKLDIAYFLASNKLLFKNIFLVFLMVVVFIEVAFCLYLLIYNFGILGKSYKQMLKDLVLITQENVNSRQARLPFPIKVNKIETLTNNTNFDIIAEITNPNTVWYVTFDYQFEVGEKLTAKRPGFILPNKTVKLFDLQIEGGDQVRNIVFSDIKWYKEINYEKIEQEKYKLEIIDPVLVPLNEADPASKGTVKRIRFGAINKSPFNYANVLFQLYLYSGEQLVAVNQIASGTLYVNQQKNFEVNFFQQIPSVSAISIVPVFNLLDSQSFIK